MAIRMSEKERISIISAILEVMSTKSYSPSPHAFKKAMPYSYHGEDGATKYCLVFKHLNFVIKYGSSYSNSKDTLKEVEIYQNAIQRGIEHLFPQTELLVEVEGIAFVIQEKVQFSVGNIPYYRQMKNRRTVQKTVSDNIVEIFAEGMAIKNLPCNRYIDRDWLAMCISLYGKRVCKELCRFVQEHKINDLHGSNIGYLNNKPVILDFCGFDNNHYYS